MIKNILFTCAYACLFYVLYSVVKASIDPIAWNNWWSFFLGDYLNIWHTHIKPKLPDLTNPVVLVIAAIFALGVFRNAVSDRS